MDTGVYLVQAGSNGILIFTHANACQIKNGMELNVSIYAIMDIKLLPVNAFAQLLCIKLMDSVFLTLIVLMEHRGMEILVSRFNAILVHIGMEQFAYQLL